METQINSDLSSPSDNIKYLLSCNQPTKLYLSNNSNEDINVRQQGGTCTGVRGRFFSCVSESGSDLTGLGRWNWMELKIGQARIRLISATNHYKLKIQYISNNCATSVIN